MKKLEPQPEILKVSKGQTMYTWKGVLWWGNHSSLLDERFGEGRVVRLIGDTWYILEESKTDNLD